MNNNNVDDKVKYKIIFRRINFYRKKAFNANNNHYDDDIHPPR